MQHVAVCEASPSNLLCVVGQVAGTSPTAGSTATTEHHVTTETEVSLTMDSSG